jgi:hypothetical protein
MALFESRSIPNVSSALGNDQEGFSCLRFRLDGPLSIGFCLAEGATRGESPFTKRITRGRCYAAMTSNTTSRMNCTWKLVCTLREDRTLVEAPGDRIRGSSKSAVRVRFDGAEDVVDSDMRNETTSKARA